MDELIKQRQLSDGTRVQLRTVRPGDRYLLAQGFEALSEDSRYRRFLMHKEQLSESELTYLTELDGVVHHAVAAVSVGIDGQEIPLGIARYIKLEQAPEVAEAAITVIDDMQGKGVGKLLIRELGDAAYRNGVRTFRCNLLASNEASHRVLLELDPLARAVRTAFNVHELELRLSPSEVTAEPPASEHVSETPSLLERLLKHATSRSTFVRSLVETRGVEEPALGLAKAVRTQRHDARENPRPFVR